MANGRDRAKQLRSLGRTLAVAVVFAAPLVFAGCRALGGQGGTTGTPVPTAEAPTPTPQPTPEPTPTPAPQVTQDQAQGLVRDWFNAMTAGDYQKAQGLATGNAADQTKQIGDTIQSQASQRGVGITMQIQKLDLSPAPQPSADTQAVNANFTIQVNATKGPFSIPAQTLNGSATFVVQATSNGPKISDIQNVSGLPGQ